MAGKCPKCGKLVTSAICHDTDISVIGGEPWKGVTYVCPMCQTVLGCQIDPISIKADIVEELFNRLRQGV